MNQEKKEKKVEILEIGKCILSMDDSSDIRIECTEPINRITIEKSDMDFLYGLTEDIQKHVDVIKKTSRKN